LHHALQALVSAVRHARTGKGPDRLAPEALAALEQRAIESLASQGWAPDYLSVRRQRDLLPPQAGELLDDTPLVALGAARIGATRLLDNIEL
jgi:pantoate--beta-alanine ligase